MVCFVGNTSFNQLQFISPHPTKSRFLVDVFLLSLVAVSIFLATDTFIRRDTRTQKNISKLNDELYEVHQIMTRNVQEVLGVGEKLDQVSQMSSRLTSDTRIYADKARDLNRQALIKKWAPVAIVVGFVILLLWAKNKIW
ncbi:hypothetical protein LXL04_008301 [Taraxacum kok-saghyz]